MKKHIINHKKTERTMGVTIICLIGWMYLIPSLFITINVAIYALRAYHFESLQTSIVTISPFLLFIFLLFVAFSYYKLWKMRKIGIYGIWAYTALLILLMIVANSFDIFSFILLIFSIYLFVKRKSFN